MPTAAPPPHLAISPIASNHLNPQSKIRIQKNPAPLEATLSQTLSFQLLAISSHEVCVPPAGARALIQSEIRNPKSAITPNPQQPVFIDKDKHDD